MTDIWFSGRIKLIAWKPSGGGGNPLEAKMWFGGPLTFRDESGRVHDLDAGGASEFLIALFEPRHHVIDSAVAGEASQMQIYFELDQILTAGTLPQYENWGSSGPDGLNLVGLPGLYSEEIDATGEQIGNVPQAFTHLAIIAAALNLDRQLHGRSGNLAHVGRLPGS